MNPSNSFYGGYTAPGSVPHSGATLPVGMNVSGPQQSCQQQPQQQIPAHMQAPNKPFNQSPLPTMYPGGVSSTGPNYFYPTQPQTPLPPSPYGNPSSNPYSMGHVPMNSTDQGGYYGGVVPPYPRPYGKSKLKVKLFKFGLHFLIFCFF